MNIEGRKKKKELSKIEKEILIEVMIENEKEIMTEVTKENEKEIMIEV